MKADGRSFKKLLPFLLIVEEGSKTIIRSVFLPNRISLAELRAILLWRKGLEKNSHSFNLSVKRRLDLPRSNYQEDIYPQENEWSVGDLQSYSSIYFLQQGIPLYGGGGKVSTCCSGDRATTLNN